MTRAGRSSAAPIAASNAGDLIVPWALALAKGLKAQDIAGIVVPLSDPVEASKRAAAVAFLRPSAEIRWVRRLIGLARRLG